ncbi:MAG TPA: phosphatidylinositol-specific phospholipase C/glycerophosphodiester phosphodiesterase family protein [Methylomirabilota bacterium]|nr:phosphatidylinositol-specific phospholipase C/glycerophosphodiester phosphodiesterase family protein [Methylomirabilota bacterium]
MMVWARILLAGAAFAAHALGADTAPNKPLFRAHAHNDYLHARPLADALAHGFWSVEADIWLTNGVLLVAHDFDKTSPERTLQKLYLDPLRAFVKTNRVGLAVLSEPGLNRERGAVRTPRPTLPPITLLIDVKSAAEPTWAALHDVLKGYSDIFTRFESNVIHTNAVIAIISGSRAEATMRGEAVRFAALDGRLPDLESNPPVALVPLISDNWTRHFKWRGNGPLPEDERAKLRELVARTHAQGRRIRLWAAPDTAAGWKELRDAGVDLLNTDKLAAMQQFLREQ